MEERVGEPVFLSVKMPFDAWFEVEIKTFSGRMGIATGREVDVVVEQAVEMLLEMDEVIVEVTGRNLLHQNAGEAE